MLSTLFQLFERTQGSVGNYSVTIVVLERITSIITLRARPG